MTLSTTERPKTAPAPDAGHCRLITYHQDPSHGWLEAPISELRRLGLLDQISRYSYTHHGVVYLEEDCDAPKYLEALKAEGQKYRICVKSVDFDHPCRCLPRWDSSSVVKG